MKLRHLLLGRKVVTNLDSILKSRDITLSAKVHLVKAMVFPTVMYRCERWIIKKAEHWRIDAFELWCWRRLLRVPWTARRSNQSIPKDWTVIGRTDAEAEAPICEASASDVKSLMWKPNSLEKTLMLRKTGHEFEQTLRDSEVQRSLACCSPWGHRIVHDLAAEQQQNECFVNKIRHL